MRLFKELQTIVAHKSLLNHPFYQAWNDGTLSKEELQTYAYEYGQFIALMDRGWTTLADKKTAEEEREHAELWEKFSNSIGTQKQVSISPEVQELIAFTKKNFSHPVGALGALFAFEVQQPETAKTKLHGLREKYETFHADEEYFTIHSHNEHESEKLLQRIVLLSVEDQELVKQAAKEMSERLWNALSGVYRKTM